MLNINIIDCVKYIDNGCIIGTFLKWTDQGKLFEINNSVSS